MVRMHTNGKGMSSSALPYKRTPPSWLKTSATEVRVSAWCSRGVQLHAPRGAWRTHAWAVLRLAARTPGATARLGGRTHRSKGLQPRPWVVTRRRRPESRAGGRSSPQPPARPSPPRADARRSALQVEDLICKFSKKGLTPSQIGVLLRDNHGIAQVGTVTGSKVLRILKGAGA